ncbi:hypothetical protein WN48_06509 [Eufriesea mexicana]|uniref:DPY30 domain-containing protein 2 n=1 Tax=Eufriesea mexicana TaxID=516756 RepID=A0A310STL6_9HYME|nr:hypothetical protein WN48_06509 [Eufriesea mexicana]
MPNHNQLGCLPLITTSERCSEINDKIKKISEDCNNEDIEVDKSLKKVFHKSEEKVTEEESETYSCTSLIDESELSFDGKWLRKFFKVPLKMAIKEIVSKKPYDPVHYLGFWLLNYRRCEERRHWQLERDNELNYLRSLVEEPISKKKEVSVDIGEEEEEGMRDWNFKHYETMHISKSKALDKKVFAESVLIVEKSPGLPSAVALHPIRTLTLIGMTSSRCGSCQPEPQTCQDVASLGQW